MTSTTDTAEHPEVSELSDLTEGLLSPPRTDEVRHHLSGCELCADVHASLVEIRDALGTLPGPPRMPADVAERIDAALAAEALLDATASKDETAPEGSAVSRETEPHVSRETEKHVSRETSTAPTPPLSSPPSPSGSPADRPAGRPRAATGPGRSASGFRRRRRGMATAAIGAVVTAAAIGLGTLMLQPGANHVADTSATKDSGTVDSRTFSEADLGGQVASLLAEDKAAAPEGSTSDPSVTTESSPRSPQSRTPLREADSPSVPECVKRGIGRDTAPLAAKRGTYQGTGAYLVVLPHANDASRVSAYVVDASCVDEASPATGEVLLTDSYPRS